MQACLVCWVMLGGAPLLESPGGPFLSEPALPEKHGYWLTEFQTLDADRSGQISAAEYQRNGAEVVDQAERLIERLGYAPPLVSMLYAKHSRTGNKLPPLADIDRNGDGQISFHREYLTFPGEVFEDFSRWDPNADGKVTREEYVRTRVKEHRALVKQVNNNPESIHFPLKDLPPGRVECEFTFRDRNQDGVATWQEFRALHAALPHKIAEGLNAEDAFYMYDKNFDALITEEEFLKKARASDDADYLARMQHTFRLKDADGNQQVTFDEFLAAGANDASQFFGRDRDEDGVLRFEEVAGVHWVGHGKHKQRDRSYFARLDHNGDGQVTWDEYRTTSLRQFGFSAIDVIEVDNRITPEEWQAVEQLYRKKNGQNNREEPWAYYATAWMPGIFDLIHFEEIDANRDDIVTWAEFQAFPEAP